MGTFLTIVFIVVFIMALIVFLLDVFGPTHSQTPFWNTIHTLRRGLDAFSYWFLNICAIAIQHFIK